MDDPKTVIIGNDLFRAIETNRGNLSPSRFVGRCVNLSLAGTAPTSPVPQPQRPPYGLISLDGEIMRTIDRSRGALTRSDFVARCLDTFVSRAGNAEPGPDPPPEAPPAGITRHELRELSDSISGSLRTLQGLIAVARMEHRAEATPDAGAPPPPQEGPPPASSPREDTPGPGPSTRLSLRTRVIIFSVMANSLAWLVDVISLHLGGTGNHMLFPALLLVAQFAPGISAGIMLDTISRDGPGFVGLRWGDKRYLAIAYGLMLAIAVVTFSLTVLVGWGRIDSGATSLKTLLNTLGFAFDIPSPVLLGTVVFSALTVGMLVTLLSAFGEELGWRGYLLTNLLPLGKMRACLITGVIWGVWHAPGIMMGNLYPGYPYLGTLMITVMCVLLGIIFGWLRIASGSLWPAVVAHAALNTMLLAYLPSFLVTGVNPVLGGGTGVIGLGVMAAVAAYIYLSGRLK